MHQLGTGVVVLTCAEDRIHLAGQWIGRHCIAERKLVSIDVVVLVLTRVSSRLCKGSVGEAFARPGNVRNCSVEDPLVSFVSIEALPDQVSQVASSLRDPDPDRVVDPAEDEDRTGIEALGARISTEVAEI